MPADTSQPSLKEVLRQKRAEYILKVAETVLAEKGYRDASMDEIAALAGVSKGTLYQHFSTKDDLIFALIDQSLVRFEQIIQQASVAPESAQSKLERILRAVHVEQHGVRTQLHRLLESDEDIRSRAQQHQRKLRARVDQATGQIRSILEEGKATGTFDTTISTELMLQTFLHLISTRAQERLFTQEHLSPEEVVVQMRHLFFHGIVR
ncbi:MAG: TetR family transcriptional regulator [Ktedonobacteraceae bacterium]